VTTGCTTSTDSKRDCLMALAGGAHLRGRNTPAHRCFSRVPGHCSIAVGLYDNNNIRTRTTHHTKCIIQTRTRVLYSIQYCCKGVCIYLFIYIYGGVELPMNMCCCRALRHGGVLWCVLCVQYPVCVYCMSVPLFQGGAPSPVGSEGAN
jgi:hypothetical protein